MRRWWAVVVVTGLQHHPVPSLSLGRLSPTPTKNGKMGQMLKRLMEFQDDLSALVQKGEEKAKDWWPRRRRII